MRLVIRRGSAVVAAVVLVLASCGDGGDDNAADPTSPAEQTASTTAEPTATTAAPDVEDTSPDAAANGDVGTDVEAFCAKNDELVEVRAAIYGEPFTETPEEIEALMAEAETLQAELDALVPEKIREPHELHMARFVVPIDALTQELGWDPMAAMNSDEAAAIFTDPEVGQATEELMTFMQEHCGFPPIG